MNFPEGYNSYEAWIEEHAGDEPRSDPRCVWLSDELCGCIYNALAQAYHNDIGKADEFHARWKAAPADPVEVAAMAASPKADWAWERYPKGYHDWWRERARSALRALGMPDA
jgi:hypothetical protein